MKNKLLSLSISSLAIFLLTSTLGCTPKDNRLDTLAFSSLPEKDEYVIGESLSLKGMVVVDTTDNKEVNDYNTEPMEGYVFDSGDIGRCKVSVTHERYKPIYFTVNVLEVRLKTMDIISLPYNQYYYVGNSFSLAGLELADHNSQAVITKYTSSIVEGYVFTSEDIGEKTVTISKEGYKDVTFTITVSEDLNSVINYALSSLNSAYSSINMDLYDADGKQEINDIFDEYSIKILSAKSADEVYAYLFEALEKFLAVEVKDVEDIVGIVVTSLPRKTSYSVGDTFDPTGLSVALEYSNGEKVSTTSYDIEPPDMSIAQENAPVVISYLSFSTSFYINIYENHHTGKAVLNIYATNDIHGQIEGQYKRASFATLATYLKSKGDNENTLLLDQGDTWQGSIYSNNNRGALMTDVMNYVKFDARTVGNHDFDWGVDALKANTARSYDGYSTPVLAGNVYDFDFEYKIVGNTQQSDIGTTSVTYTLENGLKVGIIGTIGKDQITSIDSLYTQNIAFIDHIAVIKEEASKLRDNGCNIIISSCHADQDDLIGNGLQDYIDIALCAHSHQNEQSYEGNLLYLQANAYSQSIGNITVTYDFDNDEIYSVSPKTISASTIENEVDKADSTIKGIIDDYMNNCTEDPTEVVAKYVDGSFYSSEEMPNLVCKAIYDRAIAEGYDVDLAYCNNARASLYSGSWSYADIYQAFPFDNTVYIIEASYDEMMNEIARYNFVYRSPNFNGVVEREKTYKVACLSYLVFHTNSARYYDYFGDNYGAYLGILSQNYRLILKDWLKDNGYSSGQKTLRGADFATDSSISFSRNFVGE